MCGFNVDKYIADKMEAKCKLMLAPFQSWNISKIPQLKFPRDVSGHLSVFFHPVNMNCLMLSSSVIDTFLFLVRDKTPFSSPDQFQRRVALQQ